MDFEVISLIASSFSDCCISIYLSCVDGSADKALTDLRINQHPTRATHSMLIDIDEFLIFKQDVLLDDSVSSIRVNWLMTSSREHYVNDRKAFYIPIFKTIARNDCILKIKNPHEFILNTNKDHKKSPVTGDIYNIYILHHWCRSLGDVVIKSSSQNILKNPKNVDVLSHGLPRLIDQSELPRRFRYAAYLEAQQQLFSEANIIGKEIYSPEYSAEKEAELVRKVLNSHLWYRLENLYCEYLELVKFKSNLFPQWPHRVSVNQVCETLPSLISMRDA
ncbi:hypothetical protein OAZ24_02120 [Synechococcus sp. AH-736-G21]|nr:hypothetical protein [Synechococcus sp. AH-736-G21]